jgi:TolB-like protein
MSDIFISYSRKDSEQASKLAERLRSSGSDVWMDTASLAAAETWSAEIVDAIKACSTFIVLLSPHSVVSINVTKECALASEKKKRIVPIVVEKCELNSAMEYALAGLQKVSLHNEEALSRSLQKLGIASLKLLSVEIDAKADTSQTDKNFSSDKGLRTPDSGLLRIAVLPFEDQSPANDNEWFSDGLTDELISTLNKLDALFVLDRNSSKIYKDAKLTTKQMASELGVRYIVTGAVRKAGDKLRIGASLIDGISGAIIWDEKFNGTMENIFDIQEQSARDIAHGLKLTLTPEEDIGLGEKMTDSPEVYELLLQAARKLNVEKDYTGSLELLTQALAIRPSCLAAIYIRSINFSNIFRLTNDTALLEQERTCIKQLTELGPESYYCLAARANYYLNIGESDLATEMAERAVQKMPKAARAYSVLGFIYSRAGKPDKATVAFRKALEIDPSSGNNRLGLLLSLFASGALLEKIREEYHVVKEYLLERLAEFPDNITIRREYLNAAVLARLADDAVSAAVNLLSHELATPDDEYCSAEAYLIAGDIDRGRQLLRSAIDKGQKEFSKWDEAGFISLKGTPEYDFLLSHIVQ